jgi:hypothetical protein
MTRSECAFPLVMRPKGRRASLTATMIVELDEELAQQHCQPEAMNDRAGDQHDEKATPGPTVRRRSGTASSAVGSGSRFVPRSSKASCETRLCSFLFCCWCPFNFCCCCCWMGLSCERQTWLSARHYIEFEFCKAVRRHRRQPQRRWSSRP